MEQPLIYQDDKLEEADPKPYHPKISNLMTMAFESYKRKPVSHWILLTLSSLAGVFGLLFMTLLQRYYYMNGGKNKYIVSGAVSAGWPLIAFVLVITYFITKTPPSPLTLKLALSYIGLGILGAINNVLFTYAYAYLPASTASLLGSTILVFSALFGHFLVKNRIQVFTINAIVIITSAMIIVALDSKSDGYQNITYRQYIVGFICSILSSAGQGLGLALSELVFVKLQGRRSFVEVFEQKTMVLFVDFVVTSVFITAVNGLEGVINEAKSFEGGANWYYLILIFCSVCSKLGIIGSYGTLFLSSTVSAGVLNAVRVPLTSIAAVVFFNDPMSGFKILSLFLTTWGFCSYIYGNF